MGVYGCIDSFEGLVTRDRWGRELVILSSGLLGKESREPEVGGCV
jgi:hypothetical protein